MPVRYVSLFSGIEAATVAWEPLGWEPMAFCEIEPFPCAVLEERFPSVPNMGDVSKVDWGGFVEDSGRPDLVVGGSPCQSFSVAGKREGLDGASGLMWEYVRAVAECRPRWVVWENVPGALSSTHGEDFRCLLESLDELGYRMAWRVLDAQFFGVAQRRRRVFLVGDLGAAGGGAVEVLLEPESLCGDPRSSREKRAALAANTGIGAQAPGVFSLQSDGRTSLNSNGGGWQCDGSSYTLNLIDRQAVAFKFHAGSKAGSAAVSEEVSPTLIADWHNPAVCIADDNVKAAVDSELCGTLKCGGSATMVASDYVVRRLTPTECERLQGFPDGWTRIAWMGKPAEECPDGPRYRALGNSMAVPVMRWIGKRIGEADER